ncbi:MAG: hypothetical protein V4493_09650 [Pseudomonadota bacterium]
MRNIFSVFVVFLAALLMSVVALADPVIAAVAVDNPFSIADVLAKLPDWLQAASLVIAAASSISALLPMPKVTGVLSMLRKGVDFLALNFGGAKNASAKQTDKYIN